MFCIYFCDNFNKVNFKKINDLLFPYFQRKVSFYKNKANEKIKIISYFLLQIGLINLFGIRKISKIHYSKYGKPYIKKIKNIHFNISHTNDAVACAISNSKVGVDILNRNMKANENIVYKLFSKNEIKLWKLSKTKKDKFLEIWTKKEAYIKYKGQPVNHKIANIDTTNLKINTIRTKNYLLSYMCKLKLNKLIFVSNPNNIISN